MRYARKTGLLRPLGSRPGEAYNAEIREAIEDSQLLVFLISPHSVTEGHYTLTELESTEHEWPKPRGHVQ
ncbi:MAG: toll/interleukin-1 receptor domain-containing protein [Pyrinomonadaceae bacterium]